MGLDSAPVKLLCAAKSIGVDFTDTAMIGRQSFCPTRADLQRVLSVLGSSCDAAEFLRENQYGEKFFEILGAKQVASVDASKYEGASHLHDMNQPLPDHLRERFSVVHDGGTLEHIFNVPQALKNCMEMVKVGGHFTQVTIANNFMGHGFWQFSPELIYRVFCPGNGFRVDMVLLHEVVPGGAWHLALDPEQVRRRVELCNRRPTYILTIAKRVAIANIFATVPQQSDYVAMWKQPGDVSVQTAVRLAAVRRLIPRFIKQGIRRGLNATRNLKHTPVYDPNCYQRIGEEDLLRGKLPSRVGDR